jgi:glycosyltransferase involved in cell wall biosynthesis
MSNHPLHIVYTGPFRFPDGDAAASRVLNTARALRMAGHRVEFLSYGGKSRSDASSTDKCEFEGFNYTITHDIDRSGDTPFRRIINFLIQGTRAFSLLKRMQVPDVVILYNPALVMVVRMLFFTRKRRIGLVADLTEFYHPSEFPGGKWMPFAWINELNIRCALRAIASKLVISSYLDRYYPSSANLIVPPLVDTSDEKWRRKPELLPVFEGISCIYAGTPTGKDQVLFVVDALKQAIEKGALIRLIFLGDELDEIKQAMLSADYSNCRRFVIFPGKVPQHEVPAWYNTADFSLLFREHNRKNDAGFPTKFVESMAAGVPVIGNLTSDLGTYLVNGYNGFIVNKIDAYELSDLFLHLNTLSSTRLSELKKAAGETAVQHFNYKSHQERLTNFLSTTAK